MISALTNRFLFKQLQKLHRKIKILRRRIKSKEKKLANMRVELRRAWNYVSPTIIDYKNKHEEYLFLRHENYRLKDKLKEAGIE